MPGFARKELQKIAPYVPGKSTREIERQLGIKGAIKLASNENPLGPSPFALERLEKSLPGIFEYPDGLASNLRSLLASKFGVDLSQVIVGNGSDEVMEMVAKAYLRPFERVVTSDFTFSLYSFFATMMNGRFTAVPLKGFRHDLELMAKIINTAADVRLVYLASPNNPTGGIITHSELKKFLDSIPPDVIVVIDEAYAEYVGSFEYHDTVKLLSAFDNLVMVRTFSKAYGLAGLRIGYGISTAGIISDMFKTKQPFNVSSLAQAAAEAALADVDHLQNTIKLNCSGLDYLYGEFDAMNINYLKSEANFILFELKNGGGADFYERLLMEGVIIRHIRDRYLRVSIGTMPQNIRFADALKKVLKPCRRG